MTAEQTMPANLDAERAVLGAILIEEEAYTEVAAHLSLDDWSLDSHRRIWARMLDLGERGEPIDILNLQRTLSEHRELEAIGGVAYLALLTDGVVKRSSVMAQVKQVVEKSRLRKVIYACNATVASIFEGTGESSEFHLGGLQESLLSIQTASRKTQAQHISEIVPAVLAELDQQATSEGLVGMPTEIASLDATTTGIRAGELWVVGALPKRGKTALGIQIALANAEAGNPALVFSLEMASGQMVRRMLAARVPAKSGITASTLREPRYIGCDRWTHIRRAASQLSELPLYLDDTPSLDIRQVLARARLYKRRYGIRLVIVDYLRLVQAPGKDTRIQVGYVADALRQLAKGEQLGVVLLSQLRRPAGGLNQQPTMLDLKESGDIEAHAHVVLLLYQPVDEKGVFTHQDEINVGAQREGPTGPEYVRFNPDRLQFEPRSISTE